MFRFARRLLGLSRRLSDQHRIGPFMDLRLATCMLLLEVAHADGHVTSNERHRIELDLIEQFGLGVADGKELIALAEQSRTEAVDVCELTSYIAETLSLAQRAVLAHMLRSVAHSDGHLDRKEHYVVSKIRTLLRLDSSAYG